MAGDKNMISSFHENAKSPKCSCSLSANLLLDKMIYGHTLLYHLNQKQILVQSSFSRADFSFLPDFFLDKESVLPMGRLFASHSLGYLYSYGAKPIFATIQTAERNCSVTSAVLAEEIKCYQEIKAFFAQEQIPLWGEEVDENKTWQGISVAGFVHPRQLLTQGGSQPEDLLFLTKPLGSGLLLRNWSGIPAAKQKELFPFLCQEQQKAAACLLRVPVSAVSYLDRRGFWQCLRQITGASYAAVIWEDADFLFYPELSDLSDSIEGHFLPKAEETLLSAGTESISYQNCPASWYHNILSAGEYNGGFLISVAKKHGASLEAELEKRNLAYSIIGKVTAEKRFFWQGR